MLQITGLRAKSLDLDATDLFWEAAPGADPLDYTVRVLRSEVDFGPYEPVSRPFSDRYLFRDTSAPQRHFFRRWHYKLQVTRTADGEMRFFPGAGLPGVSVEATPDLEALEMARHERLRLQEFTGRKVWVFPVRTFGQRCTACWDMVSEVRTRSACTTCFDTSFVGGFHSPVEVPMSIINPNASTQLSDMATLQTVNAQGKLANYPTMHEKDLVVEAENIRWRVGPVQTFEKNRWPFRQVFQLHRISTDDVAFKLPINVASLKDFEATPLRQFTNPHSPEYGALQGVTGWGHDGITLVAGTPAGAAGADGPATILVSSQFNATAQTLAGKSLVTLSAQGINGALRDGLLLASAVGEGNNGPANRRSDVYGVIPADLAAGARGDVVRLGQVPVLKVSAEPWQAGDRIYLSTTAGKATRVVLGAETTWIVPLGVAAQSSAGLIGLLDLNPETKIFNE